MVTWGKWARFEARRNLFCPDFLTSRLHSALSGPFGQRSNSSLRTENLQNGVTNVLGKVKQWLLLQLFGSYLELLHEKGGGRGGQE